MRSTALLVCLHLPVRVDPLLPFEDRFDRRYTVCHHIEELLIHQAREGLGQPMGGVSAQSVERDGLVEQQQLLCIGPRAAVDGDLFCRGYAQE